MKKGSLVRAFNYPICNKKIDLECLGVIHRTLNNRVEVLWPGSGLVTFRLFDVESIDGNNWDK